MRFKITFFISFFFCLFTIYGQQKISGRVIVEDLEIGMGITIFDKDTTEIGKTDFNGYFEIELQKDYKKLIFAGVGFEWTKINLPINCENLEIILLYDALYHYKSNRKIDRLRKKRFDKITKLHLQAYNKGLFKTEKPCFNQEFELHKPELDEIDKHLKKLSKENKKRFEILKVGDTITIPFSGTYKSDGTERTSLIVYSYIVEGENFDCKIQGVITKKQKNRKGYFLTYKVTNTNECEYKSIIYNEKAVEIGRILEQNMKYFRVITE